MKLGSNHHLIEITSFRSVGFANVPNAAANMAAAGDLVYNYPKRKKETPPAKPPPPVLPKPKFILPQTTSNTTMALRGNLKSKSELNIATSTGQPGSLLSSASSSSSHSSTSSSCHHGGGSDTATSNNGSEPNEICLTSTAGTASSKSLGNPSITGNMRNSMANGSHVGHLRNKLLENGSLVSSSQGYHSDTWDSHSSRQSFDMESLPNQAGPANGSVVTAATRYKHLNKLANKAAAVIESKLASVMNGVGSSNTKNSSLSSQSHSNMIENLSEGDSSNGAGSSDDRDSSSPAQTSEHDYMQMPPPLPNQPPPLPPSPPHALKSNSILLEKPPISTSSCSTSSSSTTSSYFTNNSKRSSANSQPVTNSNSTNNSSAIELPIYYQTTASNGQIQQQQLNSGSSISAMHESSGSEQVTNTASTAASTCTVMSDQSKNGFKNYSSYSEL